jgi:hypothetical protein
LKPDGTEFDGGVWFANYEDWHLDEEPTATKLMSGRSKKHATHNPVGFIPKIVLGAVRPETTKRLQEMWGRELYVAEIYDKSLTISLLAKPVFARVHVTKRDQNDLRQSYWESNEITAEILEIRDLQR